MKTPPEFGQMEIPAHDDPLFLRKLTHHSCMLTHL